MAEAASFAEGNFILDPPEGVSNKDCNSLNVCKAILSDGKPVVISCWKITADELIEITKTGRIYVMVRGYTIPPIAVVGCKGDIFPQSN